MKKLLVIGGIIFCYAIFALRAPEKDVLKAHDLL
jgi:hypothetical protein